MHAEETEVFQIVEHLNQKDTRISIKTQVRANSHLGLFFRDFGNSVGSEEPIQEDVIFLLCAIRYVV